MQTKWRELIAFWSTIRFWHDIVGNWQLSGINLYFEGETFGLYILGTQSRIKNSIRLFFWRIQVHAVGKSLGTIEVSTTTQLIAWFDDRRNGQWERVVVVALLLQ